MRTPIVGLAIAAVLTAGCVPTAAPVPALSAAQFKAAIVGQKLKFVSADWTCSVTAMDTYNADGTLTGTYESCQDSGDIAPATSWVMHGNEVCVTHTRGKPDCHTLHKVDDVTYIEMTPNGSLHGPNTILK